MSHRMDEIKPEHYITEKQCQEMIDKAIDKDPDAFEKLSSRVYTDSKAISYYRKFRI